MEAQIAIKEINRYKEWKAEKHIKNKATRTENQLKGRTNTSSRETETEKNNTEKTNQRMKDHAVPVVQKDTVNSTFSLKIQKT